MTKNEQCFNVSMCKIFYPLLVLEAMFKCRVCMAKKVSQKNAMSDLSGQNNETNQFNLTYSRKRPLIQWEPRHLHPTLRRTFN